MLGTGNILGGKLRLDRLVRTGKSSEVFQGRDLGSGQRVAVKVLRFPHTDQLVRFEREARMLAELDHPNIVRYLDHAMTLLGQPYLVTEWLDGEDLATRLRTGPLTARETLAIGQDVAEAMAAAHERGIIHRDLKPGNVFLMRGEFSPSKCSTSGSPGCLKLCIPIQFPSVRGCPSLVPVSIVIMSLSYRLNASN